MVIAPQKAVRVTRDVKVGRQVSISTRLLITQAGERLSPTPPNRRDNVLCSQLTGFLMVL